jgi:hypothetical protein
MDLEQALARIADLEDQVTALTGERDAVTERATELAATQAALDSRLGEATVAHDAASADLAETRARGLTYLRRALLAEQAGQIVPELVGGDDEEALLSSVEVARQAYTRALDAARATIASQTVPAGAPSARTLPAAGLSPLEMIESGLRR